MEQTQGNLIICPLEGQLAATSTIFVFLEYGEKNFLKYFIFYELDCLKIVFFHRINSLIWCGGKIPAHQICEYFKNLHATIFMG